LLETVSVYTQRGIGRRRTKLGCPLELLGRLGPEAWCGIPAYCGGEHFVAGRLRPVSSQNISVADQRLYILDDRVCRRAFSKVLAAPENETLGQIN